MFPILNPPPSPYHPSGFEIKSPNISVIWRRKPTPVLLPGKAHGRRSLVGYSPWGRKVIDYDLDVKVFPDLSYKILDEDEYRKHIDEMGYSVEVQEIINQQLSILIEMIQKRRGPFAKGFAEYWYYVYRNRLIQR